MLKGYAGQRPSEAAELIVVWASSDRTRCVLAFLEGVLELRLEDDGEVIRRAHYIDIRPACDVAQQWRVDWDIESRWRRIPTVESSVPSVATRPSERQMPKATLSGFGARPVVTYGSTTPPGCGDIDHETFST